MKPPDAGPGANDNGYAASTGVTALRTLYSLRSSDAIGGKSSSPVVWEPLRYDVVAFLALLASTAAGTVRVVMNNVGALALLMPAPLQSAAKAKRAPALILMPLSFGSRRPSEFVG